jgi:SAM-dependent methyltransferase
MINKKGKTFPSTILKRTQDWKKSISDADLKNLSREFNLITDCPICGKTSQSLFKAQSLTYSQCLSCNHLFLQEMPKENELINLYKNGQSSQGKVYIEVGKAEQLSKITEIMQSKFNFFKEIVDEYEINIENNSTWVDIGSGIGNFLSVVKLAGFKVLGLEIDEAQCNYAKEHNIETLNIFFDEKTSLDFVNDARVISMLNILEHAINPHNTYRNLLQKIKPNTLLLIEVPRSPSLSCISNAIGLIPTYRHATPSEHLNIFSDKSMTVFLETYQIEILGVWNFGSDAIDFVDTITEMFFKGVQIDKEVFANEFNQIQFWIDQFKFSDNMLLVARKQ